MLGNRKIRKLESDRLAKVSRAAVALQDATGIADAAREAARLATTALQAELNLPLTCRARLMPAGATALRGGCCHLVVAFAVSGETAVLELEDGFAAALADRLAGGAGTAFAPGPLTDAESAAVSFLALSALRSVRDVALFEQELAVRFVRLARSERDLASMIQGRWLAIDLDLALGALRGGGRLLVPASAVDRLAAAHPSAAPALPASFLEAGFAAHVLATGTELATEELEALRPGDVLRLDALARTDDGLSGRARLAADGFHLRGTLDSRAFSVASIDDAAPLEVAMDATVTPPPLPIEVEVELARVRIPLSELARLQPGAVIGLDMSLSDHVLLRVGDRAIARAELVDIEGELGARIVSLLS